MFLAFSILISFLYKYHFLFQLWSWSSIIVWFSLFLYLLLICMYLSLLSSLFCCIFWIRSFLFFSANSLIFRVNQDVLHMLILTLTASVSIASLLYFIILVFIYCSFLLLSWFFLTCSLCVYSSRVVSNCKDSVCFLYV